MRKSLLIITIILMAASPALYSQLNASFGVKGGISLANQSYRFTPIEYKMETEALVGPTLSLFVEAFRATHFSLQVDLSYAQKGSSTRIQSVTVNHLDNDRITVSEGELTRSTFKYISVAPMARYRFGQASMIPYVLLGPRLDMLLIYNSDSEYPLDSQNGSIVGLTCGAGLEYMLERMGLFAELQYQQDLSPVTNKEPLLINNNMISLTLGIRWLVSE